MKAASPDWEWEKSPNFHVGRKPKFPVIGVVIHYTAGSSRESTINYFNKKEVVWNEKQPDGTTMQKSAKVSASAHLVIGRDGKVTQMVDFNDRAWHAGDGIQWRGKKPPTNINDFTIGLELCNWGKLERKEDAFYVWRPISPKAAQFTTPYTGSSPIYAEGKWWEPYPEEQIKATIAALKLILKLYPAITRENIVGHQDVSPHRKEDPGGVFPWAAVLEEIFKPESVPVVTKEPASSTIVEHGVINEIVEESTDDDELHHQMVATSKDGNRQAPRSFFGFIFSFLLNLFRRK